MGKMFYNPLINKGIDSDDEEFGLKSLDDVDLDRSFSPEEVEFTKNTIQNGLPNYKEEDANNSRMQEAIKQNGGSLNPFEFYKTSEAIRNGTLEDLRMMALARIRQRNTQLPQSDLKENELEQNNIVNQPGIEIASSKPTWIKRDKNIQDLKNKEAIQNLFGNLKSKLK